MSLADWIVKTATASNSGGGLHVTGTNLSARDEIDREFRWNIGHHSIESERFDFTGCEWAPGAMDRYNLLVTRAKAERHEGTPPDWHVIASDPGGKILAVFAGINLAAAQEFARRTNAQAGQCVTRRETVTDWVMPRVGDSIKDLP